MGKCSNIEYVPRNVPLEVIGKREVLVNVFLREKPRFHVATYAGPGAVEGSMTGTARLGDIAKYLDEGQYVAYVLYSDGSGSAYMFDVTTVPPAEPRNEVRFL